MSHTLLKAAALFALVLALAGDARAVSFLDFDDAQSLAANPNVRVSDWRDADVDDTAGQAFEYRTAGGVESVLAGLGVSYAISPTFFGGSAAAAAAVRSAFATWSAIVRSRLRFFDSGLDPIADVTSGPGAAPFGANIDVFSSTTGFSGSTLAFLQPQFVIFEADGIKFLTAEIFFNENFAWSTTGEGGMYDVETVALHEIGHGVGLHHPDFGDDFSRNFDPAQLPSLVPIAASGAEVMNSTIGAGVLKRTLTADEIAGAQLLYGVPEPGTLAVVALALLVRAAGRASPRSAARPPARSRAPAGPSSARASPRAA